MSDEFREIEVVEVGSGPPRPPRPPRPGGRTDLLLTLLVLGVFLGAACSAFAAWSVHETQVDNRQLNCMYLGFNVTNGDTETDYGDLPKEQKKLIDRFDCDVPGR